MDIKRVYLDHNATTRCDDEVISHMDDFHRENYAVASSQFSHTPGIKAKDAVDKARNLIAHKINARTDEVVFTSGATESNNLALKGVCFANMESKRKKIVISKIEHFSVLHSARAMERFGFQVEEVRVDEEGFVDEEHLKSLVDDKTLLVSVIYGNYEVGTVQDIKKISSIVRSCGAYFHTDAACTFLQKPIDVAAEEIDLMSLTAHKIYGPKGAGALFVRKGVKVEKIMDGGFHEFDLRAGTENVPGIAGFGRAVEIFSEQDLQRTKELRDYLYGKIKSSTSGTLLNGASDFDQRIPNNLNLSFRYVEGESIVLHLDMRGIAVITGSACFSRMLEASHILRAMGFSHERAHGSIRFSPGKYTTKEDIDYTAKQVKEVVEKLRDLSPLKEK